MNKKRGTLLRLCKYLMRYKWGLLLAVLLTVGSNLFSLVGPELSGRAIDAIQPGKGLVQMEVVRYFAGRMALFYVASSVMDYLLNVLMIAISRRITYQMRKDIFTRLADMPVGYFDTHATGDIISRISYDTDTINASLSTDLVQIFASVITIVVSLYKMLTIQASLVLVFLVTVPLSILITRRITKKTHPLFRLRSRKLGELNGFVEEMISGQKTLKAYNQEENTLDELDDINGQAVEAYYQSEYQTAAMGPSVNFIHNLSLTLISVFGTMLYMGGKMTVGDISSFVLYSRKFSGPIREIADIFNELQSSVAAAERVFRIIDEPVEPADRADARALASVQGRVELEHVSFGYTPERTVLKDFSLEARPGQLIAIVGPTGAGKTTLINLLMRFYDPQSGVIRVDGQEISGLTRSSLRLAWSMVLQDTWLFYGTIAENIAYGRPGATREEIVAAARAAHIHNFITRLPQGYDTILTDDAANISKGQKQLLTIARAMLMDSPMLILDEATSNVDTRTEMVVQQAMRELMQGKTCFVVAHRLSTVRSADRILVVRDGNVVESGTHPELMARKGFYWELYQAQFA
ncbi:MAG: ABC transporter ATP-binding protein [Clostridiaceae bacterium]|nr:ABC transporter ATP-binding protein [Clostridiaceae bacterium]